MSKENVDSIEVESWGHKQYKHIYNYHNLPLSKFKIKDIDSIQVVQDAGDS